MAKGTEIAFFLSVYDVQWQVTPVRELTPSEGRDGNTPLGALVVTLNTENPNLVSTPDRSQLMRALVVDTDPKQIKTLLLLLRKEGFEAKGCTTAAEALSIIRKMDIGIVVIDLRLPDIQGSHLVECLLEKTRAIKAIIHTTYGSFAVAKEVINHGAFAFVEKRDDSRELIRQVHRAAESRLNQYAEELEGAVAQRTAELTLSQKWMESLVRSVHGVLWEFDVPTSRFTYVSEQAEHLLGYPPQQWITDPTFFQDHLHPEDRNWVLTYCQQMTTYKKDHEFEYRMIAKDGGIVWIYDLVTVIIENDRPVKLQGVLIDITKRKRTEEALRESEAKFQDLYDYAPDMMASVDLRTASILHCNETFVTATGYTKKELINRPIFEMYHPDSLEKARQCFQSFKETGEIHNAELQLKRKDGSTIDVMLNVTAVRDDQGRIQHSRSIWRDITERKQATKALHDSELRSRTLLEGSPVCTKIIDLDSRLQYMSTAGQVYLKIADIEPFYGCTFPSDFYPESVRASIVEHLERAKLGETSSVECPVLDTKGNEVWFHTTFVPARDDDGRIKYIIVTSVNITERKNIEERERSAQRLIAAVSDVQARFIGDQKPAHVFEVLLTHLLDLTKSEYGFIGEVLYKETGDPYMRCHAITDLAWNDETRELIKRFAPNLEFFNLNTLFGRVMTTGQVVIANDPAHDRRSGGLPEGHPPLNAFLGLPFYRGDQLIGLVGIANRPDGYTQATVEYLQPFLATCTNLIDAYRQAESVRTLESQLHQAVQASKTGLWDWNTQSKKVFFSEEWKSQLGYTEHEIADDFKEWESRLHPDDHDRALDYAQRYVANPEGEYSQEYRLRHKDGSFRWIAARASFVPEADGRRVRLLGSHTDITAMKELEAQLDGIIHSAMEGIITINENQEIIIFNEAAEKMFGCSTKEALGQSINHFIPELYRDSHSTEMKRFAESGETKRGMGSLGLIFGLRANGEEFPIEAGISKLEQGKHRLYTVVLRDITEREKAEETLRRFERIVSASRSLLSLIDRDYRYQAVNQQCLDMFGVSREHFLGHSVGEIIGQECFEQVIKPNVDRCLAGEVVNFKHWLDFPKGGQRYLDVQLSPYSDDRQIVQAVVWEARDITDLHHLEEQVRQSQKLEAIGTLAAGIAHDFNNILTAILGFGELAALKVPGNQPVQRNLAEIVTAGKRAKDLVRQILLFSRQAVPCWEPLDLRLVVQETLRFLRASIPSTIDISQDVETAPIFVNGDATQLEQILLNLGANAEHAMRSRKGQLEVTLHSVELDPGFIQSHPQLHPGLFARLTMRDTGTGIAQDILPKIFDPFFTTKEVNEGTGLGLSVVHGIVIAHGGAITVDSKLEHGTTFTLYLPQISPPIEERELGFREVPRSVLTGKILVVDDEEPLARLTQELLRTFGFEVMAFTDPAKALEAFRADPESFAVVMTDQVMPGTTGKEVIRELLAIRPNLPIILCTGYGHAMNVDEPRSVGVTAFLLKPFLQDDLLSALHRVLNSEEEVGT